MGKAFLGFIVGIALTILAFVVFDGVPVTPVAEQSVAVVPPSPSAPDLNRESIPLTESTSVVEVSPTARTSETTFTGADLPEDLLRTMQDQLTIEARRELLSAWTDEELRALISRAREMEEPSQEMREAANVRGRAEDELRDRQLIARWKEEGPPAIPIVLPPEFSYLSGMTNPNHELLQRDPIDPNWSPQMEAQLRGFFNSRPDITSTIGYPTINCRTIGCEMAFVSYGPDGRPDLLRESEIRFALDQQPWTDQLNVGAFNARVEDGVTTILWPVYREN